MICKRLHLALAALVLAVLGLTATALAQHPARHVEEQTVYEIAAQLRCVVCQNLSVADSPSEMAVNMKGQVRELLSRGYTQEQILSYFERSYGQFVLLKPKFQGVNTLVWILPIAVLAIGFVLVVSKAKKLEVAPVAPPPEERTDDPYLAQVREMVEKP